MLAPCPHCDPATNAQGTRPTVVRHGQFYRKSDSRWVQRFRCLKCGRGFSHATRHPCYRQNKRQVNETLRRLLCSGVSLRRAARVLGLNRKTVVRKLLFLGAQAKLKLQTMNEHHVPASAVVFDDMETFEHTKCKPLSITLMVEEKTRRIIGHEVSRMPAKGPLASISKKKYGPRKDERPAARTRLFKRVKPFIQPTALIKSDMNPHYAPDVAKHFPRATHKVHKGRRGCVVGQGELKRGGHDPLFSLNHTCAKMRDDIKRLARRTWCTTKKPERLSAHISLYTIFHNESLPLAMH